MKRDAEKARSVLKVITCILVAMGGWLLILMKRGEENEGNKKEIKKESISKEVRD